MPSSPHSASPTFSAISLLKEPSPPPSSPPSPKNWPKRAKQSAFRLASNVNTLLFIVLFLIVTAGIIFADPLVRLLNPGFATVPGKLELTVELTRILFPFILFLSLAAVYMGLLNSLHHFGLPAFASAAFNFVSIAVGLLLAWIFDPTFGQRSVYGFAIGVLVGGLAQWLVWFPAPSPLATNPAGSLFGKIPV